MPVLQPMTPERARADHRDMLRFMAINALAGALLGLIAAFAIIWLDAGGLGTLIARSSQPAVPILLLAGPLALTFGAAAAGSAIMLMPYVRKFSHSRKFPQERPR